MCRNAETPYPRTLSPSGATGIWQEITKDVSSNDQKWLDYGLFKQLLSSTLYKSKTVGLYGKPYDTKPVGGASCPAVMVLKPPATFSKVNQNSQMVKISASFLEHSIDNLCYATYMYKVELSNIGCTY